MDWKLLFDYLKLIAGVFLVATIFFTPKSDFNNIVIVIAGIIIATSGVEIKFNKKGR